MLLRLLKKPLLRAIMIYLKLISVLKKSLDLKTFHQPKNQDHLMQLPKKNLFLNKLSHLKAPSLKNNWSYKMKENIRSMRPRGSTIIISSRILPSVGRTKWPYLKRVLRNISWILKVSVTFNLWLSHWLIQPMSLMVLFLTLRCFSTECSALLWPQKKSVLGGKIVTMCFTEIFSHKRRFPWLTSATKAYWKH
jgi:hypothetical protein